MGYVLTPKVFTVDLTGTEYDGLLTVKCRRPSLGAIGDMTKLFGATPATMTVEQLQCLARVYGYFTQTLVAWDLQVREIDKDGEPTGVIVDVPPNSDGVAMVDDDFLQVVIWKWLQTMEGTGIIKKDIPHETLD